MVPGRNKLYMISERTRNSETNTPTKRTNAPTDSTTVRYVPLNGTEEAFALLVVVLNGGFTVGGIERDGSIVGSEGIHVGRCIGTREGLKVGLLVGRFVGMTVEGDKEGTTEGCMEGRLLGILELGRLEGLQVGVMVGTVGMIVEGKLVGPQVGDSSNVGLMVGRIEGEEAAVGPSEGYKLLEGR